jgi:hypothetical protein
MRLILNQFLSFVAGILLTAFAYAAMLYLFFFGTFSLAGETLSEKENRDALYFYAIVVVIIITLFIAYRLYKSNRKLAAKGIAIASLYAFFILFQFGQNYFDNFKYYQHFVQSQWKQSVDKPFKMAKTMTKEKVLIGLTKQQVLDKLGSPKDSMKNENIDYINYRTDNDSWELWLYFKNDKVTEAYLYKEGLGI